jgi:hypothetical protein
MQPLSDHITLPLPPLLSAPSSPLLSSPPLILRLSPISFHYSILSCLDTNGSTTTSARYHATFHGILHFVIESISGHVISSSLFSSASFWLLQTILFSYPPSLSTISLYPSPLHLFDLSLLQLSSPFASLFSPP